MLFKPPGMSSPGPMQPNSMAVQESNKVGNPTPELFLIICYAQLPIICYALANHLLLCQGLFLTKARPPSGLHLASWACDVLPPVDQIISQPNCSKISNHLVFYMLNFLLKCKSYDWKADFEKDPRHLSALEGRMIMAKVTYFHFKTYIEWFQILNVCLSKFLCYKIFHVQDISCCLSPSAIWGEISFCRLGFCLCSAPLTL